MDATLQLIEHSGNSYNNGDNSCNTLKKSSCPTTITTLIKKRNFWSVVDIYHARKLLMMMMKKNKEHRVGFEIKDLVIHIVI